MDRPIRVRVRSTLRGPLLGALTFECRTWVCGTSGFVCSCSILNTEAARGPRRTSGSGCDEALRAVFEAHSMRRTPISASSARSGDASEFADPVMRCVKFRCSNTAKSLRGPRGFSALRMKKESTGSLLPLKQWLRSTSRLAPLGWGTETWPSKCDYAQPSCITH